MIDKLIIYLIRKKFALKKNEKFRFTNQKSGAVYHFSDKSLIKTLYNGRVILSSDVPLNWLLNKDCKIVKVHN